MKIIMLGAPGAGKGTQAQKMAQNYNIPHISTGDIFRANIKNGTELGKLAKGYMDRGELVPDEVVVNLVIDRIKAEDCQKGFILDGFPRTIPQAESLTEALSNENMNIDYVIDIEVPDEVIIERMSGRCSCPKCSAVYHTVYNKPKIDGICDNDNETLIQREDDKQETVVKRLDVYHSQTQPLIDYYTKLGVLKEVDGTVTTEEVFECIVNILNK